MTRGFHWITELPYTRAPRGGGPPARGRPRAW
jgi:hypothetical protein